MGKMKTCGGCRHGVPCASLYKGRSGISNMAGWLACEIKQGSAEERAKYLSPNRAVCESFKAKQEAA